MTATARVGCPDAQGAVKELRLAVVCYGGSSLAVYMHGVTKELHRLVRGSALAEDVPSLSGRSERVYAELLAARAAGQDGVRTRVVIDIVAGTSAGGINGVYLAKALAHNRPLEALRDLWFTRADMQQLIVGPKAIPWKLRLLLYLPQIVRRHLTRGGAMAQWLFGALEEMDAAGTPAGEPVSLLPEDHLLELYLTGTDFYGYDRQLAIADPPIVHDRRHRHLFAFRFRLGGEDDFGPDGNGGLAFAARTTSCFPGVFPPVSLGAFRRWVPAAALDGFERRSFRSYVLAGAEPARAQLVDGGVLDNRPFGPALAAIRRRPADVEVDRKLLYLEPDPHGAAAPGPGSSPRPVQAMLGALSGIPRQEPILDDLLTLEEANERVARIQEVVRTSFEPMRGIVAEIVGQRLEDLPADLHEEMVAAWSAAAHARAIEEAGLGYVTYVRLKIADVVERFAEAACVARDYPADSNHAQLVRAAVRAYAARRGLFAEEPQPTQEQVAFLRSFDLGYGRRRLRFVIDALGWWYRVAGDPGCPTRAQLDAGKRRLYEAVELLESALGGEAFDDGLRARLERAFPEDGVRTFVAEHGLDGEGYLALVEQELDELTAEIGRFVEERLAGFGVRLYGDLARLTTGWSEDCRRDLLVRYFGFPLWDVLLYPVQALADLGERDAVEVIRLSPFEARVLSTPPEQKVQGKAAGHFFAFFDRRARENDYLWGRLDGAAHLVGIVLGKDHPEYRSWCLRAFGAILDEESEHLPHIAATVRKLADEVRAGPSQSVRDGSGIAEVVRDR